MLQLIAANMTIFWIVFMVLFLIVEAATAGLTTIWFAVGALAALISALCNAAIWLQMLWFLIISIAALVFTRPLVRKYVNRKSQPTNADMVIGMEGRVVEPIDNVAAVGAVSVGGKIWSARSVGGEPVPAGTLVVADRIEGVKLFVAPVPGGASVPAEAAPFDEANKE